MKLSNPKDVRKMDMVARRFIAEAVGMFNLNHFDDEYAMYIEPKTKKAFVMYIQENEKTVSLEEFTARNLTSPNGTLKVVRLMNYIDLINM